MTLLPWDLIHKRFRVSFFQDYFWQQKKCYTRHGLLLGYESFFIIKSHIKKKHWIYLKHKFNTSYNMWYLVWIGFSMVFQSIVFKYKNEQYSLVSVYFDKETPCGLKCFLKETAFVQPHDQLHIFTTNTRCKRITFTSSVK